MVAEIMRRKCAMPIIVKKRVFVGSGVVEAGCRTVIGRPNLSALFPEGDNLLSRR